MAKSLSRNSPGSSIASFSGLNASCFCSLTCVTMPPPTYAPKSVASQSASSNECALTFFTVRGFPSLSSVIPRTSANVTRCPSWSSTRSSSTHVTSGVASLEMEATMHVRGSSPSKSCTSKAGPKSQNKEPKTPRTSPRMNFTPFARHISSTAIERSREDSVHTTT